jgi:hypothetical protein
MTKKLRAQYKKRLTIDPEEIDACLVEQAELFGHVAEQHAEATAEKDAISLELEELTAKVDRHVRERLYETEDKVTEKMVVHAIREDKSIVKLRYELADAKAEADAWSALEEAFKQRSNMLRQLVSWKLGEMYNLGIQRGTQGGRALLRDAGAAEAEELRSKALRGSRE